MDTSAPLQQGQDDSAGFEAVFRVLAWFGYSVVCFRTLNPVVNATFRVSERELILAFLRRYNGVCSGIYWTLNPVGENHTGPANKAAIIRRRHVLIDLDRKPKRSDENATEEEKQKVWLLAVTIITFLRVYGIHALVIDSGNGYHLIFRVDLDRDDNRVERLLRLLAARFDTDDAEVDTSVFDPARITKTPDTNASKSRNPSPERPARDAIVLEEPSPEAAFATAETLDEMLAALTPPHENATQREIVPASRPLMLGGCVVRPDVSRREISEELWPYQERLDRAKKYLTAIGRDLSRSGNHGHDQLWKHFRACMWGFALDTREALYELATHYNTLLVDLDTRFPGQGYEVWSDAEIEHKLTDVLDRPDDTREYGYLLREGEELRNFYFEYPKPDESESFLLPTDVLSLSTPAPKGLAFLTITRDGEDIFTDKVNLTSEKERVRIGLRLAVQRGFFPLP